MKSINKKYVLGFLLIFLVGVGLIFGGIVHQRIMNEIDFVETQGYVVGVETRYGENGTEYRPYSIRYFVEEEGKYYETSVHTWFSYPIMRGDAMNVWYKKDEPTYTIVGNADKDTMSYALIGVGAVLAIAGIALTFKYIFDVKRAKR